MKPRWTGAAAVAALAVALLPMAASAAPLPAPAPSTPSAGATVDQPLFTWAAVDGADHYEIEVALDDQFVTVTEAVREVNGTAFVPTVSYTAKTHFWHVRAVASDGTKGDWSGTREFTRRWTSDDEAVGVEQSGPSSRVENVRLTTGGSTPTLDEITLTWDAVPGAGAYQVEVGATDGSATVFCTTPHTSLAPPFDGSYSRRSPLSSCDIQSPLRAWVDANAWTAAGGDVSIESEDIHLGDLVYVRFLSEEADSVLVEPFVASVTATGGDPRAFTVAAPSVPGSSEAVAQYFRISLPIEVSQTYYARVRALDLVSGADYPATPVYGMWSDERPEPGDPVGSALVFTPAPAANGSGSDSTPVVPDDLSITGTDSPTLSWEPVPDAAAYKVTVALDRDFTNRVATYKVRGSTFVPPVTLDDNSPGGSYYWFATPCDYLDLAQTEVSCSVPDRLAINDPAYVGRFSKRSTPVTGLTATSRDTQTNALLRWGDALTAAQALDASFTPGGVEKYEVQITDGSWSDAVSVVTDNLAYSTAAGDPLPSGTYRWRVRPYDGQAVPLAWATGTDFTIVRPDDPDPDPEPSPTQSTPNPGSSTPGGLPNTPPVPSGPPPDYQAPPPDDGTATDIPPERPGKPGVRRSGRKYLRVHWRASEELGSPVSHYMLYRSTNGNTFSVVKRTTTTTVRVKASRKKTYWFYVVADSEAGRSERSSTTKFPK